MKNIQDNRSRPRRLFAAIEYNIADSVKELLTAGTNPNAKMTVKAKNNERDYYTPLIAAASYKNPEIIKMLIAAGANVNLGTKNGFTPLHYAAWHRNTEIFKMLKEAGAKLPSHCPDNTPTQQEMNRRAKEMLMALTEGVTDQQGI